MAADPTTARHSSQMGQLLRIGLVVRTKRTPNEPIGSPEALAMLYGWLPRRRRLRGGTSTSWREAMRPCTSASHGGACKNACTLVSAMHEACAAHSDVRLVARLDVHNVDDDLHLLGATSRQFNCCSHFGVCTAAAASVVDSALTQNFALLLVMIHHCVTIIVGCTTYWVIGSVGPSVVKVGPDCEHKQKQGSDCAGMPKLRQLS